MSREEATRFPTTRWSLVNRAADPGSPMARQALDELLRRYLRPLRSYLVRARGVSEDQVDDLLQGFIATRVLEQELLASADPRRGRFRAFLLHVLNRYVTDEYRSAARQKRGPGAVPLEGQPEPADASDPQAILEAEWAVQVLDEAVGQMKRECDHPPRPQLWRIFEARVLKPVFDDAATVSQSQLVEDLQLASPQEAYNLLATAKRMFLRCLRSVVGQYTETETEIDEEILTLRAALARGHRGAGVHVDSAT